MFRYGQKSNVFDAFDAFDALIRITEFEKKLLNSCFPTAKK